MVWLIKNCPKKVSRVRIFWTTPKKPTVLWMRTSRFSSRYITRNKLLRTVLWFTAGEILRADFRTPYTGTPPQSTDQETQTVRSIPRISPYCKSEERYRPGVGSLGGSFTFKPPPPGSIYRIWLAPVWNFSWSDSSFFRDYTSPICFFGGAGFPKWLEFGYWVWVRTAVFQKKIIKPIFPLYSSQESVEGKNIGGRTTLTKTQHNLSRSKNKRKKSRGKKKKTRHYN